MQPVAAHESHKPALFQTSVPMLLTGQADGRAKMKPTLLILIPINIIAILFGMYCDMTENTNVNSVHSLLRYITFSCDYTTNNFSDCSRSTKPDGGAD